MTGDTELAHTICDKRLPRFGTDDTNPAYRDFLIDVYHGTIDTYGWLDLRICMQECEREKDYYQMPLDQK